MAEPNHDLSMENFIGFSDIFPSPATNMRRLSRIHDSAESLEVVENSGVTVHTVLATLGDLTTWHTSADLKPMVLTSPLCLAEGAAETIELHLGAERPDGSAGEWSEIAADAEGWCVMVVRGGNVLDWFSLDSIGSVMRISIGEQPAGVLKIIIVKRLAGDRFEALPVIPVLALPEPAAEDMIAIFNKMSAAKAGKPLGKGDALELRQQVWVNYYRHLLWDIDAFLEGFWTDADPEMNPETFESVMDAVLSYLLGVEAHHAAAYLLREAVGAGWQVNFHGNPVEISADYLKDLTGAP